MKKFLTLISIILTVFIGLQRENISLWIATELADMSYYIGDDRGLAMYNEAVLLIAKKEYSSAKSLLQPLLNQDTIQNPADVYELYGDLVYTEGGATGDVLIFYHRSREFSDTTRIQDKIALIESGTERPIESISETQTGTIDGGSGAEERAQRRSELTDSGYSRSESIDLQSGMDRPADIISRTLDLITTETGGVRDW